MELAHGANSASGWLHHTDGLLSRIDRVEERLCGTSGIMGSYSAPRKSCPPTTGLDPLDRWHTPLHGPISRFFANSPPAGSNYWRLLSLGNLQAFLQSHYGPGASGGPLRVSPLPRPKGLMSLHPSAGLLFTDRPQEALDSWVAWDYLPHCPTKGSLLHRDGVRCAWGRKWLKCCNFGLLCRHVQAAGIPFAKSCKFCHLCPQNYNPDHRPGWWKSSHARQQRKRAYKSLARRLIRALEPSPAPSNRTPSGSLW